MKKILFSLSFLILPLLASAQIPYWHQTNGPLGGTVDDITIDSSGRVIVWTRGSGVYRSTDNGNTWSLLNKGLLDLHMYHGAASKSGYLFGINAAADGQTVFRFNENDPNAVWDSVISGANDILADPNGKVYVADGEHGVYRSDDNGATWTLKGKLADTLSVKPPIDIDKNVNLLAMDGRGNIYAGLTRGAIYRSSDKGETWTKLPTRNPDGRTTLSTMAVTPIGTIAIGTDHGTVGTGGHIYVSFDTAKTWQLKYTRPVNTEELKDDIDKIIVVPGTNIFYANAHGPTLRSTDGGVSWTVVDTNKRGDEVFEMAAMGNLLFQMCEPDGVFLSTDGGYTWVEKNNELQAEYMWGMAINSKQELFAITEYGLWYSGNNGDTWQMKPEYGEDYSPSIWIDKKDNIFIGTSRGLFRSQNNGDTLGYVLFNLFPKDTLNSINQVGDDGHGKLYCASNLDTIGFVYSVDEGVHWTKVNQIPNQIGQHHVKAFGFATADTILVSSGTSGSSDFYRTTDAGITWQYIGSNHDTIAAQVLIHPDGSYLIRVLGITGGVFRSTDGAHSWTKIFPAEGLPFPSDYYSMMVDDKGSIIVTTDSGVYRSKEGITSFNQWYSISEGLSANDFPGHFVNTSVVVENRVTHVYFAATRGLGVFKSIPNLSGVTTLPVAESMSVYPNPSTASLTISYYSDRSINANVDIFDILGRRIKNIFSGMLTYGDNIFSFNASNIPSGNYMLVLHAGEKNITTWITIAH